MIAETSLGSKPENLSLGKEGSSSRGAMTQKKPIILSTTRATKFGTWNVRTMYEAGKLSQIAAVRHLTFVVQKNPVGYLCTTYNFGVCAE